MIRLVRHEYRTSKAAIKLPQLSLYIWDARGSQHLLGLVTSDNGSEIKGNSEDGSVKTQDSLAVRHNKFS